MDNDKRETLGYILMFIGISIMMKYVYAFLFFDEAAMKHIQSNMDANFMFFIGYMAFYVACIAVVAGIHKLIKENKQKID